MAYFVYLFDLERTRRHDQPTKERRRIRISRMLPTWTPFVCGLLMLLLWMTCSGISSLRIDTFVFDDWGNETNFIRMLMEDEVASWTQTLETPVFLHFTNKHTALDHDFFELDPSILESKNNIETKIMIYNIQELILENKTSRRLLINVRRVIILASYSKILNFFNEMEQRVRLLNNEWILIPTDSDTCPGHLNMSYICIHQKNTSDKRTPLWMDALQFIKGAIKTMEGVNATASYTNMEFFRWYASSHQPSVSISKYTSYKYSTLIGEFSDGQITIYGSPDVFEHPPPPVLKVVIIHEPPFVQRVLHDNGSISYEGYSIDVLQELARRNGFTYQIYEVPDNEYGVLRPNGTWTGVIGQVATGVADMGAGPISVTAERETVIDFTAPYYDYAGLQILTKDTREPQSLFVFVTVFTELAWGVWVSLLVVTVVILCVFHRFKYKYLTEDKAHRSKEIFTIKNSLWFVAMSVAIAGPQHHPTMTSTRLVVAGFWFFCQIIMSAYTANLAAFLTSSRLASPVESLDDLVTQSTYQYTVQKGTVGETYFQRMAKIEAGFYSYWKDVSFSTDSNSALTQYAVWDYPLGDKYIKLWQSMQRTGYVTNTEEGIAKVLEGNFVLFHETPMIKFEMSRRCGLLSVGTMFSAKPYAFVLPQNSPLVKNISSTILAIQSTTLLTKLKEKWWESNNVTCLEVDNSDGLTLNALGGIFIVISGGCLLSLLVLGVEILIDKYGKASKPFLSESDTTEESDGRPVPHQVVKSFDVSDGMLSKLRSYESQDSVYTSSL
ncbi:ionotropic receptor 25a-like [Ylistrum balloti]|uniref:ionotropic receptor 25a-like n=1 Tax=Ylistrum balloti TaxID=509963 RepID=UPI002905B49C|nr:ionotropic receptor 25a-like [Ylistrum balloti]